MYNCKWVKTRSDYFKVLCGSKQGGILSPDFFAIYIDDLIKTLRASKIGCHILNRFIACIVFADDMSLLAPTRGALQQLLDICAEYCNKFCLNFNVKKSKVMVFGRSSKQIGLLANLGLGDTEIEFVSSFRYLGFNILSGTCLRFSSSECLRGFFGSVNSIFSLLTKPKENVLLQLLYSNCVPKLTYGASVKNLSAGEKHQYNVAVNNAVRRIFGFRYWQSIRQLREFYGFDPIEVIFAKAQNKFRVSLANHGNTLLRFLHQLEVELTDN